jgi:DNA transposition AAA+ family ATPase
MSEAKPDLSHTRGAGHNISYELSKLEAHALTLPPQMREDFVWLGRYVDKECGRNLSVLETRVRGLGFDATAGTFSKILRGHWQTDAKGRPVASPVLKAANFIAICNKLRSISYQAALAGSVPFIKTPTFEDIEQYIKIRRQPDRICKFGLIIGPTGAQKTASFKQYCLENNHGACTWLEAGEGASLGQLITDLAAAYGCSRHHKAATKRLKIHECVDAGKTVILDNIQRCYKQAEQLAAQPLFSFLQKLQDEKNCTIIMSATPEFHGTFTAGMARGYFEQFEGRCGGASEFLILPEFAPAEDVQMIAGAFGLKDVAKHSTYLEEISRRRGRIRILFNALQTARQLADAQSEELAIEHVRAALGEEAA